MVCLGNICRSPLAEGILRKKVFNTNVEIDSAGTGAYHIGNPPDPRSIKEGRLNDLDISDLRARQFNTDDFKKFDRIYVMDQMNYDNVIRLASSEEEEAKVSLILDEIFPGEDAEVPDPYTGGQSGFTMVYRMLDEACDEIVNKYKLNHV